MACQVSSADPKSQVAVGRLFQQNRHLTRLERRKNSREAPIASQVSSADPRSHPQETPQDRPHVSRRRSGVVGRQGDRQGCHARGRGCADRVRERPQRRAGRGRGQRRAQERAKDPAGRPAWAPECDDPDRVRTGAPRERPGRQGAQEGQARNWRKPRGRADRAQGRAPLHGAAVPGERPRQRRRARGAERPDLHDLPPPLPGLRQGPPSHARRARRNPRRRRRRGPEPGQERHDRPGARNPDLRSGAGRVHGFHTCGI